ncbi:hypothetical protein GUJ93_ZPchr0008g11971 [Zizania palustris]|uniref:Uncharacterized protein n=1 Tax=Zizania palustris TaxID=103762 RepID=A0A8J5RF12_ZIZPA|nr:hypothetical protein GUJ93_ZPchr0008g11971 [Zizania palustris]
MAALKVYDYLLMFTAFLLSGLTQLSMAQGAPRTTAAPARATAMAAMDAKAIDQAIAYLLMLAALFVTYFAR